MMIFLLKSKRTSLLRLHITKERFIMHVIEHDDAGDVVDDCVRKAGPSCI